MKGTAISLDLSIMKDKKIDATFLSTNIGNVYIVQRLLLTGKDHESGHGISTK